MQKHLKNYGKMLSIGIVIFGLQMAIKFTQSLFVLGDQIISKTYMTRVEGENSRLRHYLARLNRKTFCYSKSEEMLFFSIKLLVYYLKEKSIARIIWL